MVYEAVRVRFRVRLLGPGVLYARHGAIGNGGRGHDVVDPMCTLIVSNPDPDSVP